MGLRGPHLPAKPQCYGQAWRHREGRKVAQPGGRELFGVSLGVTPQLQPLEGMLLRRSTDIYPKELARNMREFFNSLLGSRRC